MKIKKVFVATILSITTLLSIHKISEELTIDPSTITYNGNYSSEDCLYATYCNQDVYISKDIDELTSDISVLDLRDDCSDIKILSSYKVRGIKDKAYILSIISNYNANYPSDNKWDRTRNSLLNEWYVHNLLYDLNLYEERTKDVDFENSEEETYKVFTIK